jgi:hypothetical protein
MKPEDDCDGVIVGASIGRTHGGDPARPCRTARDGRPQKDPAVRCPGSVAAGILGGLNIKTLAEYRATRRLA